MNHQLRSQHWATFVTNLYSDPSMTQDKLNENTVAGMKTDKSFPVSIGNVVG